MKYWPFIIGIVLALGCKKGRLNADDVPISPTTGTRTEFTLDSIYLYAREVYLWNDALPAYADFNPRKYAVPGTEQTVLKQELFALSQLKVNVRTGLSYEYPLYAGHPKFSFMEKAALTAGKTAASATDDRAVLKTALLSTGSLNVAYLAMGSFPALKDCRTQLDEAFASFTPASPKHMVIDLRSNAGGYVETAEYIANLIAAVGLNGKIMYTEQYKSYTA